MVLLFGDTLYCFILTLEEVRGWKGFGRMTEKAALGHC